MLEPGQPFPETADSLRKKLELLRKQRDEAELTPGQYAHMSARLIRQIEQLDRKRRRVALT